MANYTIELRHVVEGRNIFNFNYPFYDEKARVKFENDFIKHFYFREIGSETIDRFIWNLEDKFTTVFPYYNELFKATQIEYSVLDNYSLKETITTNRENTGRSGSVSSTVGQTFDEQHTENSEGSTTENNSKREGSTDKSGAEIIETSGSSSSETQTATTDNETGSNSSNRSATEDSASTTEHAREKSSENSSSGATTTETNGTETANKTETRDTATTNEENKKFLDTPQGAVDLTNSNYLTTLNHDSGNNTSSETSTGDSNTENNSITQGSNESTTITDENETSNSSEIRGSSKDETEETTTENNRNSVGESSEQGKTTEEGSRITQESVSNAEESTDSETRVSNGTNAFTGEQKTTQDNNTRSESSGTQREVMETVRSGNIGVDADADMIQKHIKLQQILKKIELMFFDECEDLFMGVY